MSTHESGREGRDVQARPRGRFGLSTSIRLLGLATVLGLATASTEARAGDGVECDNICFEYDSDGNKVYNGGETQLDDDGDSLLDNIRQGEVSPCLKGKIKDGTPNNYGVYAAECCNAPEEPQREVAGEPEQPECGDNEIRNEETGECETIASEGDPREKSEPKGNGDKKEVNVCRRNINRVVGGLKEDCLPKCAPGQKIKIDPNAEDKITCVSITAEDALAKLTEMGVGGLTEEQLESVMRAVGIKNYKEFMEAIDGATPEEVRDALEKARNLSENGYNTTEDVLALIERDKQGKGTSGSAETGNGSSKPDAILSLDLNGIGIATIIIILALFGASRIGARNQRIENALNNQRQGQGRQGGQGS